MKPILALLIISSLSACAHFGHDSEAVVATEHCYAYRYGDKIRRINFTQAFDWCYRSANYGNPDSQVLLAELYYLGLGGKRDGHNAAQWYLKAAKQGHAHGQFMLYTLYKDSNDAEKRDQSLYWLHQAKEGGYKPALNLAP